MSLPEELILKENGDKKVKLLKDRGNLSLSVTDNGWQWTSVHIDGEILNMIIDVLTGYLESPVTIK